MAKLAYLFVLLALAACSAEPPRFQRFQRLRRVQSRRRPFFARQELAPAPAPAPYPNAEELKPEVPFVEQVASQPSQEYGPPAQTYGAPIAEQLPAVETPQELAPNPDAEEFSLAPQQPQVPSRFSSAVTRPLIQSHLAAIPARVQQLQPQRLVAAAAPIAVAAPLAVSSPIAYAPQYYVVQQPYAW